jgi:hypothetical protein
MDGLFFLMSIVGVGLLMWWVHENDKVDPDKPTRGWFAMSRDGGIRQRTSRAWRAAGERMPGSRKPESRKPTP